MEVQSGIIWNWDVLCVAFMACASLMVILAYTVRLVFIGKARFERVDREGGSALLSKGMMEMGYWALMPLGKIAVSLGISPNALSWSALILSAFAGGFLAFGHFGFAALCMAASSLLDVMDGMVARLMEVHGPAGAVLDSSIDRYTEFFYLAGVILYYRDIAFLVSLALVAMMGSFMVSYSTAKAEALQIRPPRGNMRRAERGLYFVLGAALSPLTIPWLETPHWSVPLGYPMVVALTIVAVFSNISAIERLVVTAQYAKRREETERRSEGKVQLISDEISPKSEKEKKAGVGILFRQ